MSHVWHVSVTTAHAVSCAWFRCFKTCFQLLIVFISEEPLSEARSHFASGIANSWSPGCPQQWFHTSQHHILVDRETVPMCSSLGHFSPEYFHLGWALCFQLLFPSYTECAYVSLCICWVLAPMFPKVFLQFPLLAHPYVEGNLLLAEHLSAVWNELIFNLEIAIVDKAPKTAESHRNLIPILSTSLKTQDLSPLSNCYHVCI